MPICAGIAPGLARIAADFFDRRPAFFIGTHERKPTVAELRQAAQRALVRAAEPDRDRPLDRQWIDAGVGDLVPAAVESDQFLGPELAQHFDLLLRAPAAIFEIFTEGFVFHRVPADTDTEAQAAAA